MDVRHARFDELDTRTLYGILALRAEVFVVEQDCVYLDPDGRDLEPDALQVWAELDGSVVATLRLLRIGQGGSRIGRVATAASVRGGGYGVALMRHALTLLPDGEVVLGAQAHLEGWYGQFGFVRDGADYVEDDIPHLPMRLRR